VSKDSTSSLPAEKNHFIFHAKIKMSIRFQAAGIGIFMTVPLMGYGILCFFFVTNGVCNRDSIDLKKCDGEEKEKNK
jgi:hypothetical protein